MSILKKNSIDERIETMHSWAELFKWEYFMAALESNRKDELPGLLESHASYLAEAERLTELKESKSLKNRLSRLIKK